MSFKHALIILVSSIACLAQQTSRCDFSTNINFGYTCRLDNMNTATIYDFVNLNGNHKPDHTDDRVRMVIFNHGRMTHAFPEMVYDRFPNLEFVSVTGNLQIQQLIFPRCERLRYIQFEGPNNAIVRLANGVFRNCINLEEIFIQRSQIAIIEIDVFQNMPSLRRLRIPRNQIMSLPAGVFRNLNQLEFLDLERNAIVNFEPQVFQGLANLNRILCGQLNNRIWPGGIFTNLPNLVEIDINWSGLQTILPGAFGNLPSLEIIRIYGEVRQLSSNIFQTPLPRLHTFNINRNQIAGVQRGFFNSLPALRTLTAQHNICINRDFVDIISMEVVLDAFEACFANYN